VGSSLVLGFGLEVQFVGTGIEFTYGHPEVWPLLWCCGRPNALAPGVSLVVGQSVLWLLGRCGHRMGP
jgi:hypothetical protein